MAIDVAQRGHLSGIRTATEMVWLGLCNGNGFVGGSRSGSAEIGQRELRGRRAAVAVVAATAKYPLKGPCSGFGAQNLFSVTIETQKSIEKHHQVDWNCYLHTTPQSN